MTRSELVAPSALWRPSRRQLGLGAIATVAAGSARAAYPERAITFISGYGPGGATDVAARILAEAMAPKLSPGARIIVENRPGAAGAVASEWLARQTSDGYALMVTETGAALTAPVATIGTPRYDPIESFTHLGFIGRPPAVLVVTPALAAGDPAAILARLRAAPKGSLTYASSGFGGMIHMWGEMVSQSLQAQAVHVPYRSGANMVQAIMTNEAQFGVSSLGSAMPMLPDRKVVPVALVGRERSASVPGVPTLAELGVTGFETGSLFMLVGPPRMPDAMVRQINDALQAALADPKVRERLTTAGLDPVSPPNGPKEAREEMVRAVARMKDIVEQTGIRIQP